MSDWREPNRRFIRDFIHLYKDLPPLWKGSCSAYRDRNAKAAAYEKMTAKLREVQPTADRESVKKRINVFRTNFRKELRKVVQAKRYGRVYVPSLWYFNDLCFLRDEGALREIGCTENHCSFKDGEHRQKENSNFQAMLVDNSVFLGENETTGSFEENNSRPSSPLGPIKCEPTTSDETTHIKDSFVEVVPVQTTPLSEGDEAELLGRHVILKLRHMDPMQKLFAEKLIHDVLFEAQLKTLTRESRVVVRPKSKDL